MEASAIATIALRFRVAGNYSDALEEFNYLQTTELYMSPNELPCPAKMDYERRKGATSIDANPQAGRRAWEDMLSTVGSGGLMVTLGFRARLDHVRAVNTANHFLRRINRRLFGKRYRLSGQSLRGAVVLEQKRRSSRAHDSPHFHFVVLGESVSSVPNNEDRIRAVVEHEAGRLRHPTLDQLRPFGPPLSGVDFVDIARIDSSDGLANYLTKECKYFGGSEDALNIGFFRVDGIVGLSMLNYVRSQISRN